MKWVRPQIGDDGEGVGNDRVGGGAGPVDVGISSFSLWLKDTISVSIMDVSGGSAVRMRCGRLGVLLGVVSSRVGAAVGLRKITYCLGSVDA